MGTVPAFDDLKLRSGIPCSRGDERGALRHTWLERRLLYELRVDHEVWLSAAPGDTVPEVISGISAHLEQLRRLAEQMMDDCSPAQLVDQGPLSALDEPNKQRLREALDGAYRKSGIILPYQERLRAAIEELSAMAAQAERVWRQEDRACRSEFLDQLERVALRLRDALDAPQGVVLP